MKNILLALLFVSFISCKGQDCSKMPTSFNSYQQAIKLVKRSTFHLSESANTSNSSWITSARYYSCDRITGYFIYTTNRGYEYIHAGMPINIWRGFKEASSKGSYYDKNIKEKYKLSI